MAQVPEETLPSVPESSQPASRQQIGTPAEAFSGNVVGGALHDLGQGFAQAGETAFQAATRIQTLYNAKAAMDHGLDAATQAGQFFEQWKQSHTLENAVTDFPNFQAQMQKFVEGGRAGLSPVAQQDYNNIVRRYTTSFLNEGANYVAQQGALNLKTGADGAATAAQRLYALNPGPETEQAMQATAAQAAHQFYLGANLPADDPRIQQKMLDYLSPGYSAEIADKINQGDYAGANALMDKHKQGLTLEAQQSLGRALKTANYANNIQAVGDSLYFGGTASVGGADIHSAILGQESGANPNVRNSSAGAVGIGQIEPSTFAQYARPGEVITNPKDNAAVSARIIDHYQQAYGNDPSRTAVAYFSGPGNVAPPGSPTPWLHDVTDSDGTHVSSYVKQVLARTGSQGGVAFKPQLPPQPGELPQAFEDRALTEAMARSKQAFPLDAAAQQASFERAKTQIDLAARLQSDKFQSISDTIGRDIVANGVTDPTALPKAYATRGWGDLPASYQSNLIRDTQQQGYFQSPERNNNYQAALGMWAAAKDGSDPAFLKLDPNSVNLSFAQRTDLEHRQAQLKAAGGKLPPEEDIVAKALKLPSGNAALAGQHLLALNQDGSHTQGYYQFVGALEQAVTTYNTANPTKPVRPGTPEMDRIIAQTTASHGGFMGIGATPNYTVPDNFRQAAIANYQRRGLQATDIDISRDYQDYLAKGGH